MVSFGFLMGTLLVRWKAKQRNIDDNHIRIMLLVGCFFTMLGGNIGDNLACRWQILFLDPWGFFQAWQGGFTFYGSFIFGSLSLVAMAKMFKIPLFLCLDIFAPSMAILHFFGRIGCFAAGCCFGSEVDPSYPLAVVFSDPWISAPLGVHLHPTQLYDAFSIFLNLILLEYIWRKKPSQGNVFLTYVSMYAVGRFIVEKFRGDAIRGFVFSGLLSTSQFIALCLMGLSLIFVVYRYVSLKRDSTVEGAI